VAEVTINCSDTEGVRFLYRKICYIINWKLFVHILCSELHREDGLILQSNVLFIALFPITGFALPEYLTAINKCKIPEFFIAFTSQLLSLSF
jgi:hypothetical protein